MILMIQFGSLVQPLIIMISIPLSIIGSVFGLYIFRQPLSLTALFGMVSLIGIVVNNAIILVDYVNFERKQGKMLEDACKEAVNKKIQTGNADNYNNNYRINSTCLLRKLFICTYVDCIDEWVDSINIINIGSHTCCIQSCNGQNG